MKLLSALLLNLNLSRAQQLWHETHAWLLDLEGNPIDAETYIFNPLCKNRIKVSAQACVTAVLTTHNDTGDDSVLDNILNCPCMERCFNGAPCRTKGDYIDFAKRNTHADYNSPLPADAQPFLASGVTLDAPVSLYWSDEFTAGGTVDTQQWQINTNSYFNADNAVISVNGDLDLGLSNVLSSPTFTDPPFSGAKIQSKWSKVQSGEFTQSLQKYGYFEAKVQVPTDRKGRACRLRLVPEDEFNLNPLGVTGDATAKKGANIIMMSNAVWPDDEFSTGIQYWTTDTGDANNESLTVTSSDPLADAVHTYGLYWTPTKLEWYFDGVLVRDEGAHKSPSTQHLIPQDIPLFWSLESQILNWLMGGPATAPNWPEACKIEYVRHFVLDAVNDDCLPKDKLEQAQCEAMYQGQGHSADETSRLIMNNCPCHFHCYEGCANCGTYECSDASLIDPATQAGIQPQAGGAASPGQFVLEYSDEFEGTLLNTNKWIAMSKGQSGRNDQAGNEFRWDRSMNSLDGNGYLVQTVDKIDEVDDDGNPISRYVSGRISTTGIVSPLYGFFEARLDTLPVEGMQSAWWLWAENGLWNYDWETEIANCPAYPGRCTRENDDHYNPYGLTYPQMVPSHCGIQPETTNAWWGSELDIIEARAKDNIMSMNIHTGGYKDGAGCYFNNHQDLQFEGLHDGFHTFGLRWKRDLLEWYYDGQLVRTIDDPLQVSRGAGFFILSQGLFGGGWFVEGNIETYEAEHGLPVTHKVDYVRYWKELPGCPDGFAIPDGGDSCEDIDECQIAIDNNVVSLCLSQFLNSSCNNIDGGYECLCDAGFEMNDDQTECVAINFCAADPAPCHETATCTNGVTEATCECADGAEDAGDGTGACIDSDECTAETHDCADNAVCTNNDPGFECACPTGFSGDGVALVATGTGCSDVNECEAEPCPDNSSCANNDGSYECNCDAGFTMNADSTSCDDIDECTDGTDNCHDWADCTNNDSSFTCLCQAGTEGNGVECVQIDECILGEHNCDELATCNDIDFTFECACPEGYAGTGISFIAGGNGCFDIDECTDGTAECPDNSECDNNDGGYDCNCVVGYKKPANGNNVCKDVDECTGDDILSHDCLPEADCTNNDGSFTCACKAGFNDVNGDGSVCDQIDECTDETDICHELATCTNVDLTCTDGVCDTVGFTCECNSGYQGDATTDGTGCTDIDECTDETAVCPDHSTCANNDGGYDCNCDNGYKKPANGNNVCKDIDECTDGTHTCPADNSACANNDGGFECSCNLGYEFNLAGTKCKDINECDVSADACGDVNAECTNNDGSFDCACKDGFGTRISCPDKDECTTGLHNCAELATCTNLVGSFECSCPEGYSTADGGVTCQDVDECADGSAECPDNSTCANNDGGYECNCDEGWKKPANGNNVCKDIDECTGDDVRSHDCLPEADCTNNDGSFTCACKAGFNDVNSDGTVCEQIDECAVSTDSCHESATCTNVDITCDNTQCTTEGFTCACNDGFSGDGQTDCSDVDECADGTNDCPENSSCGNLIPGFECTCDAGYKKPDNGNNKCKDIDECTDGSHNCHDWADCTNTDGSFECACQAGTSGDGLTCEQVNECDGENNCDPNATCTDINFDYLCACNAGFTGDGFTTGTACSDIDECTDGTAVCPDHSTCENNDGSYECNCDAGWKKPNNGKNICKDIDECSGDDVIINDCNELASCTNIDGSFTCACNDGFNDVNGDGSVCDQVDECSDESHTCNELATCTNLDITADNTAGFTCACPEGFAGNGFDCADIDECTDGTAECPEHSTCANNDGAYECNCDNGYKKPANGNNVCKDIDECELDTVEAVCGDANAICTNNDGSYDCACMTGFGRSIVCPDIDECTLGTDNCSADAACTNTEGSFECACNSGFDGDGVECTDKDECATGENDCPENSTCNNISGGFECNCNEGYKKPANGKNICKDVDECTGDDILINNCGDFSTCSNNDGSFICACDAGFADTNGDGTVCDQVDECDNATHNCNELATCTNLDITADNTAGFTCECNDGFEGNGVDCQDIDECAVGVAECPENASCTNNDGGFDCNCNEGFELNADTGACDLTVIPECECDLKTQVCDESTGTCSCKPGYLEDSSIDGCVFDFSVCPDNVKDTEVTWIGKTMRRNFVSKDSQDIVGKIKMKKMPEKDAYTGFLVFTKLYCGSNFIEAIADGSLYIEFLDKQQQYEMTDFNYFRNANTGSFATTTKQFQNTQNTLGTNTGTNSQDIVWFAIRNVDQIDMGSKKLSNCINRVQVGVMESTDQDLTGCVGHARNVDW